MVGIRKIAAILVSDVVGYSRLTGVDEDRILARLRTLRSDLIDPTIAVHTEGIARCEHALELDRNLAQAHALIGYGKLFVGRAEETEPHIAEALRLSPRDRQTACHIQ